MAKKTADVIPLLDQGRPSDAKARGFKTILGLLPGDLPNGERCWHSAIVSLDRLPDWERYDICAHLKCSKCGSMGCLTLAATGRKSSTSTKAFATKRPAQIDSRIRIDSV
jgi:hypothetical protein